MNRIMRRWVKAGALIFVATLVVAACEGPAGTAGTAGAPGTDGAPGTPGEPGPPGVGYVAIGFSYVPYNGSDDDIPHRAEPLPFGTYDAAEETDTATTAFDETIEGRGAAQCVLVDSDTAEGVQPTSLYGYEAFGGSGTVTHTVMVSYGADDAMMTAYGSRPSDDPPVMGMGGPGNMGNGFELSTSDVPSEMLAGSPNLASGDYMWTLHASDEADQQVSRSWRLRVTGTPYVMPEGTDAPGNNEVATVGPETNGNDPIEDWADFISSTFTPAVFGVTRTRAMSHMDTEGAVKTVDLSAGDGVGSITGIIEEDDIDAIWVGGLTPDVKLDVKYKGTTEGSIPNDFNEISVVLRRHVAGEGKQDAITADAMTTTDYMATYSNLACGFYYLEVEGVGGGMGDYELSWQFAQ